jgi:hypothetical protein
LPIVDFRFDNRCNEMAYNAIKSYEWQSQL